MRKRLLCSSILCLLCTWIFGQTLTPRYQSISPHTPAFYEYLPQGYSPTGSQTYPVILSLHGAGNIGNGSATQLPRVLEAGIPKLINEGNFPNSFTVGGQSFRFIVIAPQFSSWPDANAVRPSIDAILDYIIQNYKVNPQRIYLTGLSMGGGFAFDYVGSSNSRALRIAAMVPIAEAALPVYAQARTIAGANLPVWATHNSGDPNVPVSQTNQYVTWINEAPAPSPNARKTIFGSNIHDAWTQTYNPSYRENGLNIYQWMLQYQRITTALPTPGNNNDFIIFPNPTNEKINIKWENNTRGKITISIFNTAGLLIQRMDAQKTADLWQHQLPTASLSAGSYWIELSDGKTKEIKVFQKL